MSRTDDSRRKSLPPVRQTLTLQLAIIRQCAHRDEPATVALLKPREQLVTRAGMRAICWDELILDTLGVEQGRAVEPIPTFKIGPISLDAQRQQLQQLVRPATAVDRLSRL